MEKQKAKSIIESILFAAGREVNIQELVIALELSEEETTKILNEMQEQYKQDEQKGTEIIRVENSYQLVTKKENYEYIYPVIDKRTKPNLSNAALETLAIIAYNPKITRAEIENIRGIGAADACIYKLMEYNLIQEAGKADLPRKTHDI